MLFAETNLVENIMDNLLVKVRYLFTFYLILWLCLHFNILLTYESKLCICLLFLLHSLSLIAVQLFTVCYIVSLVAKLLFMSDYFDFDYK